jgi:transposase
VIDDNVVISRKELEAREASYAAAIERNQRLEELVAEQKEIIGAREEAIAIHEETIGALKFTVDKLQRILFGSKRERFIVPDGQLLLPFAVDPALVADAVKQEQETITYKRKRPETKHPGRLPVPEHLPVQTILLEPDEDVSGLTKIGEEITDEIVIVPQSCFVRRHIRPKYITAPDGDEAQRVVIARLRPRVIDKCVASNELLATIVVDKHDLHLPVYRQLERFAAMGVPIPGSTADGWQRELGLRLRPLYAALRTTLPRQGYRQVDESPVPVQDRSKKGTTHRGWMWVHHAPLEKIILFDYRRGRGAAHVRELLGDFHGYLQTDAYAAYDVHKARADVIPLACWAHVRRKFDEALKDDPQRAGTALALIRKLYAVEAEARERGLDAAERKELRLVKSLPLINVIGEWLVAELQNTLPKSPVGKAVRHAISLWDELQNYLLDGSLEIDNNLIENAIRPLALGRKNYLFAGSHEGALNIAMYRSFFATCRLAGHDPYAWMMYVLHHLPVTSPEDHISLLPQNVTAEALAPYNRTATVPATAG